MGSIFLCVVVFTGGPIVEKSVLPYRYETLADCERVATVLNEYGDTSKKAVCIERSY